MLTATMSSAQAYSEKEVVKKASKEAKALVKDGWRPASGMPSIEEQLKNSYLLAMQPLENSLHGYITGDAICKGSDYELVRTQAIDMARYNIISQMKVQVNSETIQLSSNDSEQTDIHIHVLADQNIGNIIPIIDMFREVDRQEVEVRVRMIFDRTNLKP